MDSIDFRPIRFNIPTIIIMNIIITFIQCVYVCVIKCDRQFQAMHRWNVCYSENPNALSINMEKHNDKWKSATINRYEHDFFFFTEAKSINGKPRQQ